MRIVLLRLTSLLHLLLILPAALCDSKTTTATINSISSMSSLKQRRGGGDASQTQPQTTTTNSKTASKKPVVVVVGGGPAGAAIALSLATKGNGDGDLAYDVHLYEAYPHPDKITKNAPKAYVIALGARGQRGLQSATKINPREIPNSIVSTHMQRHPKNTVRNHDSNPSLIIPRQVLAGHVLNEAEKAGAKINFEQSLIDIDFEQRVAKFQCKKTKRVMEVTYDLLVGADGTKSRVRSLLSDKVDDFRVVRTEEDSMEYQVVVLPSSPFLNTETPEDAVHVWNDSKYNSICLAFPLASKGCLFALVYPQGKLSDFKQGHATDGKGYDDALLSLFPDLSESSKSEIIQQLCVGEPASGGTCVWTSSLGSPTHGVVLVGDSGHGMWPSLGQGANCALESAAVFCQTVDDVVDTLDLTSTTSTLSSWSETVVREFNTRRHAEGIAAVDLTYGGIGARKSRGRGNAPISYKLQVAGMMLLNKFTMGVVPKPALLRLMMGEDLAYSKAKQMNFYYEKLICVGAVAVPVLAYWYLPKLMMKKS
jgi:kynurenine 3-monooxygenase